MNILKEVYFEIICLLLFMSSIESGSFTPEDAAFAFQRCRNISNANTDLKEMWAFWKFPDKKETHCYVKCFLEKLGLIDLVSRGLDANKIFQQIDENDLSTEESDFWDILEVDLSGTCKSYYTKWMQMNERFPHIFRKAFYGSEKDIKYFYQANPYGAKRRGMTAIDFCISSSQTENDNDYNAPSEPQCYWECVFIHFRYFDAYGRVDRNEVVSSFKDYDGNVASSNLEDINACVHQSNEEYSLGWCQVANALYNCLISRIHYSSEVFTKRNTWTASY